MPVRRKTYEQLKEEHAALERSLRLIQAERDLLFEKVRKYRDAEYEAKAAQREKERVAAFNVLPVESRARILEDEYRAKWLGGC